jgi:nucleoside-diphosphate-sugar epimerase
MTAVITGGLGFIGSHLVDRCLAEGMDVLVIDDCRSTRQRATELWPSDSRVKFLMADCRTVVPQDRAEVVFHLASPVGPVGVLNRAGYITPEVIDGSRAAARWAMRDSVPMIDVSTSEIYGGGDQGLCAESMPRIVEAGAWARLEYQTAKLAAEVMLQNTADLDVRIIRPFNVAGPRQSPAGGFVLPRMVQQALTGKPITVYPPGTQRRALTHVLDIVDGIWLAWRKGETNRDYNLGNPGNTCSMMSLAHEVADYVGGAEVTVVDPVGLHGEQFKEAAEKFPDATRAMTELGWHPTRSRQQIIADTVEWSR